MKKDMIRVLMVAMLLLGVSVAGALPYGPTPPPIPQISSYGPTPAPTPTMPTHN